MRRQPVPLSLPPVPLSLPPVPLSLPPVLLSLPPVLLSLPPVLLSLPPEPLPLALCLSAVGSVQDTAHAAVDTTRWSFEGALLDAGLLAFGAGWLVSSLLPAAEAERRAASGAEDVVREHADEVQPMIDQAEQGALSR
jgi:hypothetical protein